MFGLDTGSTVYLYTYHEGITYFKNEMVWKYAMKPV
jgi:hypothetical protein